MMPKNVSVKNTKGVEVFWGCLSRSTHTPFSLPIPNILCQTFGMRNLTATLCLTLAVLLGSAGVSWSADFQRGKDAYQSGDYATALREWTPLAEKGNASAQGNLGWMYDEGLGVPQDYKTAVKWYRLAAAQGLAVAQYNLGSMFYKGQGVPQDNVYAHMWLNIAASSGDTDAVKNRDIVAKKMTPADISTAQKLARECVRKKYKGC